MYIFLHYLLRTLGFLIIVAMFIILFNACGGNPGAAAKVVPMHPPPPAEVIVIQNRSLFDISMEFRFGKKFKKGTLR